MENMDYIKEKLKKYNQEHLLKYIENANDEQKNKLIDEIINVDFEQVYNLYEDIQKPNNNNIEKITPINVIDKEKMIEAEKKHYKEIGEEVIKNNQYAVVTMAGGQGTRLGFNGPKGTFKLDIGENGKYIFEILAESLKKSKDQYGILPYWYIMTSEQNNNDTTGFFEEHNFFGYEKEKVKFFMQGTLPILNEKDEVLIDKSYNIKTASDGNGGVYLALQKEKILDDMKNKNIKWVFICGVDNIMVKPIDTLFIGLAKDNNFEIASKSIIKSNPEEKVGAFCKREGKPGVIEYIELSDEMKYEKNENGDLCYGDSNIVSHLYKLESLELLASEKLQYHLAIKKNSYIDETGTEIIPEEPNSYKFEAFIFDGFSYFDDMLVMRVKREEEFAPIKNAIGIDSPETAKKIYLNYIEKKRNESDE